MSTFGKRQASALNDADLNKCKNPSHPKQPFVAKNNGCKYCTGTAPLEMLSGNAPIMTEGADNLEYFPTQPQPAINHHYENCMIQVQNTPLPTSPTNNVHECSKNGRR